MILIEVLLSVMREFIYIFFIYFQLTRARTFDFLQNRSQPQERPIRTIKKDEPVSLSLDDICHLADRERISYSARTRREAVEIAQSKTHKFDEYVSSRPHTSASGYIHDVRRETMTPKSIRSEPVPSRVNSRLGTNDFDDDDNIYPLNYLTSLPIGRECCEIIGPQVCSQCNQSQYRQMGLESCDQCFPTLRVSHENLTTAAVLQRYLPNLSEGDIQDKIAKGEIAKPRLLRKRSVEKCNQNPKKENKNDNETNQGTSNNNNSLVRTSSMFFINIRDLNAKIVSGQVNRSIGFSEKVQKDILKRQENRKKLSKPTMKPEPEQVQEPIERKAKFDPDILLSLSMQTNEPAFFAGRKNEYELPERLPDPIRFADLRDKKTVDIHLYGLEEEPEDEEVAELMS